MAKPMLIYSPIIQFFDNSGLPLNGGQVFIYQAGTTTKTNTYPTAADAVALTNANPNPIELDSAGRPSNNGSPIQMYIGRAFKMVLAPADDTDPPASPIRTEDNVTTLGQLVSTSSKSSSYTVVVSDRDKLILVDCTTGSKTITLPTAASAGDGFNIKVKKVDNSANTLVIQASGAETIDGSNTVTSTISYQYFELYCNGTSWTNSNMPQSQGQVLYDTNGNEVIKLGTTASAVNEITVTNAATGSGPVISATGGDTNIPIYIQAKGTGPVRLDSGSTTTTAGDVIFERASTSKGMTFNLNNTTSNRAWTIPDVTMDNFLVQRVSTQTTAVSTGTTVLPLDNTIPQITEGVEYITLAITPRSATNILEITVKILVAPSVNAGASAALFQDSTANALSAVSAGVLTDNCQTLIIQHVMTAGTTSSTTFRIRAGLDRAGTMTVNGIAGASIFGAINKSSIQIKEYVS